MVVLCIFLILSILVLIKKTGNNETFEFKTITTNCSEFKVSGSIAYDKTTSSIYISNINYCGGNNKTTYDEITCSLFEVNGEIITRIGDAKTRRNITLEDYLKDVHFNIDNYIKKCKIYTNESLYLEINALDNGKNTTYKIPLNLNNNCPN